MYFKKTKRRPPQKKQGRPDGRHTSPCSTIVLYAPSVAGILIIIAYCLFFVNRFIKKSNFLKKAKKSLFKTEKICYNRNNNHNHYC